MSLCSDDVFKKLGSSRPEFVGLVYRELNNGLYGSHKIADKIAEDVAKDVLEAADPLEWNNCDVGIGVKRVIMKALDIET